jgi:hypothetical protein
MNNLLIIISMFLVLLSVGTTVGTILGQNITSNQSGNMNSSTLTPMGNLTNKSSTIMSNTT